jgi:hypothetical protein
MIYDLRLLAEHGGADLKSAVSPDCVRQRAAKDHALKPAAASGLEIRDTATSVRLLIGQ